MKGVTVLNSLRVENGVTVLVSLRSDEKRVTVRFSFLCEQIFWTHTHTRPHTLTHSRKHPHPHSHPHTHARTHTHTHTHTLTHTHTRTHTLAHSRGHTHPPTHPHEHAHAPTHPPTRTHAPVHTHSHSHTLASEPPGQPPRPAGRDPGILRDPNCVRARRPPCGERHEVLPSKSHMPVSDPYLYADAVPTWSLHAELPMIQYPVLW
jgi:hypothetical protein